MMETVWEAIRGVEAATWAAIATAVFAFLLWRVTSRYTDATDAIAEANNLLVAANNRMMLASEQLLDEMHEDRLVAARRSSEDAAQRLQVALARAHRRWQNAELDRRKATSTINNDWVEAVAIDRNAIQSDVLRNELGRFTAVLETGLADWDAVLSMYEDEHGPAKAELRRRNDDRRYRLNWAAGQLRAALGEHQRGESTEHHRLPASAWDFWLLPFGASDEDLAELASRPER